MTAVPRRILIAALSAMAALPLAGCDAVGLLDPLASVSGSYDLVRIDERELPRHLDAYTLADGTRCDLDLVAGSLVLDTAHRERFELHLAYREDCRSRSGAVHVDYPVEREPGTFELRGDRVYFYPDNTRYFNDFQGRHHGGEIAATIGRRTFVFREERGHRW